MTEEERRRREEEEAARAAQAAAETSANAAEGANAAQTEAQPAQTGEQQPLNPAAPQTPAMPRQAPGVTVENGTAKIGPMNRGFTQEQSFHLNQHKAAKETKTKIVKTGELTKLAPELEAHRGMLEAQNQTGKKGLYGASDWGANEIKVDYGSIKDDKQAALFATTLDTTEDRVKFYSQYAKEKGLDVETVIANGENYLYDAFGRQMFDKPYSNAGKLRANNDAMGAVGLVNAAGETLDINTATTAQIIQACRMDPSGATGDAIYKLAKEAAKIPGSIWHGMELSADMFNFVDSAELTKSDYNYAVEEINTAFTYSDGYSDENMAAYAAGYEDIASEYADNPRVRGYMLRALNESFTTHTGLNAPDEESVIRFLADTQAARDEARNGAGSEEEAKGNVLSALIGGLKDGASGMFRGLGKAAEKILIGDTENLKTVDQIMQEMDAAQAQEDAKSSGGAGSGMGVVATGGPIEVNGQTLNMSVPTASIGGMPSRSQLFPNTDEGFTDPLGMADRLTKSSDTQGPAYAPQQAETGPDTLTYDAGMTDAQAWQAYLGGYTLDSRNMAQISRFTNPETMGVALGAQRAKAQSTYLTGGQTAPGASAYGAKASGVYTPDEAVHAYRKYGGTLGEAAYAVACSGLTGEARANAQLALMSVQSAAWDMLTDPQLAIQVPQGVNQYDFILGQNPELAAQVGSVMQSLNTANGAYAENVVNASEERAARLDGYRNAVMSGTATQEMLDALTEEHAYDLADIESDKLRGEYAGKLSINSDYFGNDGAFWQGSSMAATEGAAIRKAGGMQGFMNYRDDLSQRTQDVIDDYTRTALSMGMSLEAFLSSAGITSLEQVVGIAYGSMQSQGHAVIDDAQAPALIDAAVESAAHSSVGEAVYGTNNISNIEAAALGADIGWTGYWEGFAQAGYVMTDLATHSVAVQAIRDEYTNKYGSQGAAMYRQDLNEVIASGALSNEMAAELQMNMDRAYSIFDVGYEIDPNGLKAVMRMGQAELGKEVNKLNAVKATLNEEDQRTVGVFSGLTHNLTSMGVSTLTAGALGAAGLGAGAARLGGSIVGYGLNSFSDAYDSNVHENGMFSGTAAAAAAGNAGITVVLNMGGTGTQTDLLFGSAAQDGLELAARKGGAPLLMAMGRKWLAAGIQEGGEEVVEYGAEYLFDLLDSEWQAYDRGEGISLSRMAKTMVNSLMETDYAALGAEAVKSFMGGTAYGLLFSLVGVGKSGYGAYGDSKVFKQYDSVKLATQIAEGDVELTDENMGKVLAALRSDLENPAFCRWLDKGSAAAEKNRAIMTAALEGTASETLFRAAALADRAGEYAEKANASQEAAETAKGSYMDLRAQVADGDLSMVSAMNGARMQWTRAQTAYNEASNAAQKATDAASKEAGSWLKAVRERGGLLASEGMKTKMAQIANAREGIAKRLSSLYTAAEAAREQYEAMQDMHAQELDAIAGSEMSVQEQTAQDAEELSNAVFEERPVDEEAAAFEAMTDEDIEAEIETLTTQEAETEARMGDIEASAQEAGMSAEDVAEIREAESEQANQKKETLTARLTDRYNSLYERQMTALEAGDDDAYDALNEQYMRTGAQLESLGVDAESLSMAQYGEAQAEPEAQGEVVVAENATDAENAPEPSTTTPAARPTQEEYGRLTDSLTRRMEHTSAELERIAPARKYLSSTPIYVNESQKAEILSATGLKSISQVNGRYGLKLTTDASKGATPLDGHVLADIDAEAAGIVDANSLHPEEEILRIAKTGRTLRETRRVEKAEARELTEKQKAANMRRRERIDSVIKPVDYSSIPVSENVEKVSEMEAVSTLSGEEFPMDTGTIKADIQEYFVSVGSVARNPVLGDVQLTARSVKDSIAHGLGPEKATAFAAVPDVISKGEIVDVQQNWKGREWDTFVIAAPIKIEGGKKAGNYLCGVVVKRTAGSQKYYLHEVMLEDVDAKKEDASAPFQPGPQAKPEHSPSGAESPSMNRILERVLDVKREKKAAGSIKAKIAGEGSGYSGITPSKPTAKRARTANPLETSQKLIRDLKVGQRLGTRKMNRMPQSVLGYYESRAKYIATRASEASSIATTMHEIGHAVSDRIDLEGTTDMIGKLDPVFASSYSAEELPGEAFSEFFWRYMVSDEAAEDFAGKPYIEGMERSMKRAGIWNDVSRARQDIRIFLNDDANGKIGSMVKKHSDKPYMSMKERIVSKFHDFEVGMIDRTAAAEGFDAAIREQDGGKKAGSSLREAAMIRDTAQRRAWENLTSNLTDVDGTIIGESLADVIAQTGFNGKDYDLLRNYMLARHSMDREKQGKPVFDSDLIPGKDRTKFMQDVETNHRGVAAAADAINDWWNGFMRAYMVDTGLLDEETYERFKAINPHYVPTYRVKTGKSGGTGSSTNFKIKAAKGSTEMVLDPLESMFEMVSKITSTAMNNRMGQTFDRLFSEYAGMGLFATDVTEDVRRVSVDTTDKQRRAAKILLESGYDMPGGEDGSDLISQVLDAIGSEAATYQGTGTVNEPNVITVHREDGSTAFYQVQDKALYDLLANTPGNGKTGLEMVANAVRGMSMLTTGANPIFGIRNFMRDFQSSVNYGTWAATYADGAYKWLKGAWEVFRGKSDDIQQYKALGGSGWNRVGVKNRRAAEEVKGEVFKGYNTANLGRVGKLAGKKLWELVTLDKLNEVIEQTSRFVEYKYGRNDKSTAAGRQSAYLAAQDVTVDFNRKGTSQEAAVLRSIIPFFNASSQGIYRTARQATARERDQAGKRFVKTVFNTAMMSALAAGTCLKYLDEDEKEAFFNLSDDLKSDHFYLPNAWKDQLGNAPLIRIPVEQSPLAYAVHGLVTNAMWSGQSDEEWAVNICATASTILDGLNPVSSTIFDPLISMNTNKNWYGSNIVPTYMQSRDTRNQYTPETPDQFVKASALLGEAGVKVSPMMLQYLGEQYLGFVGQIVIPSWEKDAVTGEEVGLVNAVINKARSTLTSDPLVSNDVVSCVYDNADFLATINAVGEGQEYVMLKDGLSRFEKRRAVDEAYDLTHKGGEIYDAKKKISAGYDRIDEINADEKLTEDEKYELTSRERRKMIEIALDANEVMAEYREKYVTGDSFMSRYFGGR